MRHPLPSSGGEADEFVEVKNVGGVAVARSVRKKARKLEASEAGCGPESRVWKWEDCEEGASEFGVAVDLGLRKDEGVDVIEAGSELVCKVSFNDLPDELLANIWKRLSIRDLCSVTQTCKRWHSMGLQDELWNALGVKVGPTINCVGKSCPRWTSVKNMTLCGRVTEKFRVRRKTCASFIDCVKWIMNACWESGKPDVLVGRLNLRAFRNMFPRSLQRRACNDLNLLYEAFGMAFIDRTDYMANLLVADFALQEEPGYCSSSSSEQQHQIPNARYVKAGVRGTDGSKGKWTQLSSQDHTDEGRKSNLGIESAGVSLWREVATLWKRYTSWLTMIASHSRELWWHERFAKRQRSHSLFAPPTLYDLGVICFRSQIVLRYRIRGLLQAGFNWLKVQNSAGCASDEDVKLLNSVHHLLQELDVEDDFILAPTGYTQEKLRRCFCSALGNSRSGTV